MAELTFRSPSLSDRASVCDYRAELLSHRVEGDLDPFDGSAGLGSFDRFDEWLKRVRLLSSERAIRHGFYKTDVRLCYCGDRLVGILNARLTDEPFLRLYAGHIGYNVRPSERGHGFGRACALEALRLCRASGVETPVICTDPNNLASRRTAESVGFLYVGLETTENGITVARHVYSPRSPSVSLLP